MYGGGGVLTCLDSVHAKIIIKWHYTYRTTMISDMQSIMNDMGRATIEARRRWHAQVLREQLLGLTLIRPRNEVRDMPFDHKRYDGRPWRDEIGLPP